MSRQSRVDRRAITFDVRAAYEPTNPLEYAR